MIGRGDEPPPAQSLKVKQSGQMSDADLGWWAALRAAGAAYDIEALDVLVSAPGGWRTVVAGTRGAGSWPPVMAG